LAETPISPSSPEDNNGKRTSTTSVKIPGSAWITLIVLGSALLVTMFGETMLLPAIPDIIRDFKISYNTSSWMDPRKYLVTIALFMKPRSPFQSLSPTSSV
jgi:hypothetical protein